jgi:hypothetical protein
MRDLPAASFLLALAEEAPGTPELVERCRAIADREARLGLGRYEAIHTDLAVLYGDSTSSLARLAVDIRAGRFDAPGPQRIRAERLLRRLVVLRLEECNPDFITDNYLGILM